MLLDKRTHDILSLWQEPLCDKANCAPVPRVSLSCSIRTSIEIIMEQILSSLRQLVSSLDKINMDINKESQVYQAEQKKYIDNAAEVNMSKVLCESLCAALVSKAIAI